MARKKKNRDSKIFFYWTPYANVYTQTHTKKNCFSKINIIIKDEESNGVDFFFFSGHIMHLEE